MNVRRLLAGLACAILAVTLTACSSERTSGGFVTGDGSITFVAPDDRDDAPSIAGETLDGDALDLEEFAGETVVVNVWGSWCSPCRREAPALVEVSQEYADQDVQFVGIAIRDQVAAARAFVERAGKPYPTIFDPASQTLLGFADTLPSAAVPTTWILDDDGRVAVRVLNEVRASTLAGLIDDVQAGRSESSGG